MNENLSSMKNMGKNIGNLQVDVYAQNIGKPLNGATIFIMEKGEDGNSKVIETVKTDKSGQSEILDLFCPPEEYTQIPNSPKPYAEYSVVVEFPDYVPFTINGVQIFNNALAIQEIELEPIEAESDSEEIIGIKDHTLYGDFPPKIPEADEKPLPPTTGFVVLDKPVIPETIVVYNGSPNTSGGALYYVSFKDYIKNVASCEIYSTWPKETIKANVLAIISFTLNRVFTEWYRSKGKNYTITNSTAFDQAFSYKRTIYQTISIAVDEIFTSYITRPTIKQPLFTQYCDGKNSKCPNWLSQWGSKDLGDKGFSSINILKNYYGSSIYLATAEKVRGIPSSYPGASLRVGSRGNDVKTIQNQLNAISNNYPAIKKVKSDGIFGPATKEAVTTFQKIFYLVPDGIVGFATWYKLSAIYVAVTKMAQN